MCEGSLWCGVVGIGQCPHTPFAGYVLASSPAPLPCCVWSAGLKHYTAYSVETDRASFNGIISTFDLHDSYLAAFKRGFVQGMASNVMCRCQANRYWDCSCRLLTLTFRADKAVFCIGVETRCTKKLCPCVCPYGSSYASINGVPSCGSTLLTSLVRETWGRPEVVQVCVLCVLCVWCVCGVWCVLRVSCVFVVWWWWWGGGVGGGRRVSPIYM